MTFDALAPAVAKSPTAMISTIRDKRGLVIYEEGFNSLRSSDAFMLQWSGPSSVQIMACRLIGAKPLSGPMLAYCQLDPWEQTSVKFKSKQKTSHSQKWIWKCSRQNGGHLVSASMCWNNLCSEMMGNATLFWCNGEFCEYHRICWCRASFRHQGVHRHDIGYMILSYC